MQPGTISGKVFQWKTLQQSTETSGQGNINARSEGYETFAAWDVVLAPSVAGGCLVISSFPV